MDDWRGAGHLAFAGSADPPAPQGARAFGARSMFYLYPMAKTAPKKAAAKPKAAPKGIVFKSLDFSAGFWRRHRNEALLIPLLAFATYWMSLQYGYVLDDQIVIQDNTYTQKGIAGIPEILSTESFTGYFGGQKDLVAGARYRPLSIVSFAIEQSVFGDNTFLRHFGNILLYALFGLLLFRVLALLIRPQEGTPWWFAVPFVATVLYMLHPVHTEVVANIKGRDEIMTSLGAFGALYFALRHLAVRRGPWLVLSGVSMFLGLMSKENAITFLAVIPLTLYAFTPARGKDHITVLIPSLVAAAIYLVIRTSVIGYFLDSGKAIDDLMNNPFVEMNAGEKLATIIYTLGEYLRLLVFPHPLTHDYYPYHIPIMSFAKPGTLVSLAIYAGLVYIFFRQWSSKSLYVWGIGFFIATLSIVSNLFFPVGTFMNERFLFLPSVAFSLLCAWWLVRYGWLSGKPALRIGAVVFTVLLAGAYTVKNYVRIPAWKDALSLNGQAILVSPNSARANCFMSTAIYELYNVEEDPDKKRKLLEEAEYFIDRSLKIYPTYLSANQMKAGYVAARYLEHHDLNRLLADFDAIMQARPQAEYIRQFMEWLQTREDRETIINWYYRNCYELLIKQKQLYPLAITYLKIAEKFAPEDPRILFAIGKGLYLGGDQVGGQQYLDRAYALNPLFRNEQ